VLRFNEKFRFLHFILAGAILASCLPVAALAQEEEAKATNISFRISGHVVEIYYDLASAPDQFFNVTVALKRRFAKTFLYLPLEVSGDVGESVLGGKSRKINWNLGDEFPKGLPGEDCFFVINVEPGIAKGVGISPVVWIAGGAAVVGGVLALVLKKKSTGTGETPVVSGFPNPPGRP
jgi:hypothetical protein